ncbi:MAG: tRNA (adenosine(37)-N6)-threonylcarbamoyltransferase complex dimerization subunit type 1 TsaB [Ilumatobacter coccineus]|uniref:tRNA (Adenosine(37)-N6)-threonylcarbamoyltransferase complex dimerization subunit type 1 TsaB n=1 Tax=Ilumatobacter coccineus TaxID=467094 RepID=A0A2G6K8I8_9ACTN|nr:MAG: tRNA (adenosine(37)-N6)-threonylcarbamoyltransferase complex dimerization subunit type 1 TsaB [Ilumatobacter coccineus]
MLILGIETATTQVGVAIGSAEGLIATIDVVKPRRHAELLMPLIEDGCRHAGIELSEIDGVAVDIGPGLFTGMRVGIATAQALGVGLGVPVASVVSLTALAHTVIGVDGVIASIIDGRKGEVFWALYQRRGDELQPLTEPAAGRVTDVVAAIGTHGGQAVAVGDGAHRYRDELVSAGPGLMLGDLWYPSSAAVVEVARSADAWVAPVEVAPLYLRRPDAEINWATRRGAS